MHRYLSYQNRFFHNPYPAKTHMSGKQEDQIVSFITLTLQKLICQASKKTQTLKLVPTQTVLVLQKS